MSYLGEEFDKALCNKTCDNCMMEYPEEAKDCTETAIEIVRELRAALEAKKRLSVTLV